MVSTDKKKTNGVKKQKVKVKKEEVKEEVKEQITEKVTEEVSETKLTSELTSETTENNVVEKKDIIIDTLNKLLNNYETLEKQAKVNKNELKKVIKLYQKKSFKNKRKYDPNRTPSGFAKPSLISEELCKFLNKPSGTKMARTDVTKEVNSYIKQNSLQNPENKKKIVPDETLRKLLKIQKDDNSLTYFSMQKYLKVHFPKEELSTT